MKKVYQIYNDEGVLLKSVDYSVEGFNKGWFAVYKKAMMRVIRETKELSKLKILMFLCSAQTFDSIVVTTMKYMADELKLSYKTTWLAVKSLEKDGHIRRVIKDGVRGFIINPELSVCGRKSLTERKLIWNWSEHKIDPETGEIYMTDEELNELLAKTVGGRAAKNEDEGDESIED